MESFDPTIARQQPSSNADLALHNTKLSQKNPNLNKIAVTALSNIQNTSLKELDCEAKKIKLNKNISEEDESSEDAPMFDLDFMSDAISDVALSVEQLHDEPMFDFDFMADVNSDIEMSAEPLVENEHVDQGMDGIEHFIPVTTGPEDLKRAIAQKSLNFVANEENNRILASWLSDPQTAISNAKYYTRVDGKITSHFANNLSAENFAKNLNGNRLFYQINDTVFMDPSCGFARGEMIEMEDENGNTASFRVEFFNPEEARRVKEIFTGYIQDLMAQRKTEEKKNSNDDQHLIAANSIKAYLSPKHAAKKKADPGLAKSRSLESTVAELDRVKDEKAALLESEKWKDDIAFERKLGYINKELKKETIAHDEGKKVISEDDSRTTMQAPREEHVPNRKASVFREKIKTKTVEKTRE